MTVYAERSFLLGNPQRNKCPLMDGPRWPLPKNKRGLFSRLWTLLCNNYDLNINYVYACMLLSDLREVLSQNESEHLWKFFDIVDNHVVLEWESVQVLCDF